MSTPKILSAETRPESSRSTKRKVITSAVSLIFLILLLMVGCRTAAPGAGVEAVLVKKPYIFGHGGIDPTPVKTGQEYIAPSTEVIYVNVQPIQQHMEINDMMSSDGVPLSCDAVIRVKVLDSVDLIRRFGENWYENNIQRTFFNLVRQEVRQHGMNETAINTTAIAEIDSKVGAGMAAYLKSINMPVQLIDVTVGKVNPPDSIKNQRIETAAQQQRILTEGQKQKAEDARKGAELARAEADNAYRNAMSLSPDQFLQLENIKMQHEVCSQGAKCTFILNAGKSQPILDAR